MPGKQNDDERPPEELYTDRISRTLHCEVKGTDLESMTQTARKAIARILREDPDNLWIISQSDPRVTEFARFEDEPRITQLTVSYVFGVIPEAARKKEPEPEQDDDESRPPNVVSMKRKTPTGKG